MCATSHTSTSNPQDRSASRFNSLSRFWSNWTTAWVRRAVGYASSADKISRQTTPVVAMLMSTNTEGWEGDRSTSE